MTGISLHVHDADRRGPALALAAHVALWVLCGFVVSLVWELTARAGARFWPVWVWLAAGTAVGLHLIGRYAVRETRGPTHWLAVHAGLFGLITLILLALWPLSGVGGLWPLWPLGALCAALAVHALIVLRRRVPTADRERALVERVDHLTRSRRGVLDVQDAELRRLERDLHDGAQARLLALSMLIGRAEQQLADRPEAAELVRRARSEAGAAIAELRQLARGLAPPILTDRGLAAAVESLARRATMPVSLDAELDERSPAVVEKAAYFVVAEALTNVAKHGGGAAAQVRLRQRGDRLTVEVDDAGPGGACADGGGLTGVRHRVQALDGVLSIDSPVGGGTRIRAELPCAW